MSRIGKSPIKLHPDTKIDLDNNYLSIEGPKGKLQYILPEDIEIEKHGSQLTIKAKNESKRAKALHGLSRTIINNMIIGVSKGFCKTLDIQGVGYRAQIDNKRLVLNIGYSHPVYIEATKDITIEVENNTRINIKGISKEAVGQAAAQIRSTRPPEPYKGKGVRYSNEIIRKKIGKAGK